MGNLNKELKLNEVIASEICDRAGGICCECELEKVCEEERGAGMMKKEYYEYCIDKATQDIVKMLIMNKVVGLKDANSKFVGEIESIIDKAFRGEEEEK
jgi:hypothetical protein